jgi:asparagine synthase (glutamine-hydrolysing)
MCGFLCVVTKKPLDQTLDVSAFNRDILRHRGPDSSGDLSFPHLYVRHWRLSIVDVSENSNQPYGDGESWLVYNGEIYNYEQMAGRLSMQVPSDTALVYRLCRQGMDEAELKRARGFYSYVYITENGLTLSGARDPFGKKPLFYYMDDAAGIAAFASEERAIVECLGGTPVDFGSIAEYLLYKQVFHGDTYFEPIKQLAPGARFRFDVERWRLSIDRDWSNYYDMPAAKVFSLEPDEQVVERRRDGDLEGFVRERLSDSLAIRVPREVSACVALSGGMDSSLVAQLASRPSAIGQISRFLTVGFQASDCDESSRAAEIARALAVDDRHTIVPFPEQDMFLSLRECIERAGSPLEHPHYLSYYELCRHASRFSKVLLTGEGADELFMGYEHYLTAGASFAFREYLRSEDEEQFAQSTSSGRPFDAIRGAAGVDQLRARALASRVGSREYELKSHLLTLLGRNDKMGMAHSVEIRAPFLDPELLQVALALSESDLIVGGSAKYVIRCIFARNFPAIPFQERKIGFRVPFDEAFEASRDSGEVREPCELAARALRQECGLSLASVENITPRLGWSLLNIGLFLDSQGYTS